VFNGQSLQDERSESCEVCLRRRRPADAEGWQACRLSEKRSSQMGGSADSGSRLDFRAVALPGLRHSRYRAHRQAAAAAGSYHRSPVDDNSVSELSGADQNPSHQATAEDRRHDFAAASEGKEKTPLVETRFLRRQGNIRQRLAMLPRRTKSTRQHLPFGMLPCCRLFEETRDDLQPHMG
jgi:hypothetical protein